jgi:branched-chain amino acid transport system permease protein
MEGSDLRHRIARGGLLSGAVIVYLCLVGMVEAFDTRNIVGGNFQLSRVLLLLSSAVAAFIVARPRVRGGTTVTFDPGRAMGAGAAIGLISGAVTAVGIGIVNLIGQEAVRGVFTAVTSVLMQILTFQRSTVVGTAILVGLTTATGALGGLCAVLAPGVRRPIVVGLAVVLLMGMLQAVVRVALTQLGMATQWLYSVTFGGLTYVGAAAAFATGAGGARLWAARRQAAPEPEPTGEEAGKGPTVSRAVLLIPLAVVMVALPALLGTFLSAVLGQVGIFVLMGLGLNIVVGYAGLLDLGYVAFFAVGAYTTGILIAAANSGSSLHPGLPFLLAVPIVVLIAVVTGLLIGGPVLRLRGDYLAIVTLGFGEIARVLVTSDWLKGFLGGAQGLSFIPAPQISIGGLHVDFRNPQPFYYLALGFCLLAAFVSWRLANSRVGRAWNAMREDEQVAEAMGVSTVRYKLLAFACGAAIGSLGGALFAVQIGSLAPSSFVFFISIQALALIILGGIGSIPGVILGALILVGLPGFLTEFAEYQPLIFGAVLVAIMLYRPGGLVPNVRRTRELHEEEIQQDAWAEGVPEAAPSMTLGETVE